MALTKLRIGTVVVIVGVGALILIEHQTQKKLRDENIALQQQIAELTGLEDENQRLSNLVAQAHSAPSKEQLSELLKLRAEVGSLRRQTNELGKLEAQNKQLRSSVAAASAVSQKSTGPAADRVLKESWTFLGYADPESAFQSFLWAMRQADVKTFRASLAPGAEEPFDLEGKSDEEIAAKSKEEMEKVTGFRIISKDVTSENEVVLGVYAEGIEEAARFRMQRVGTDWRIAGPVKAPGRK